MTKEEEDTGGKSGQDTGTSSGSAEGAGPSTPGGQEDTHRYSTKEDLRASKTGTGGEEKEPQDRPRDGS